MQAFSCTCFSRLYTCQQSKVCTLEPPTHVFRYGNGGHDRDTDRLFCHSDFGPGDFGPAGPKSPENTAGISVRGTIITRDIGQIFWSG